MKKYIVGYIVILFLSNAISISIAFRCKNKSEEIWKTQTIGTAKALGAMYAIDDYKQGKRRLYVLIADGEHGFSGMREGEYEVWNQPYYTDIGLASKFTAEMKIESYNSMMKTLVKAAKEKEKSEATNRENETGSDTAIGKIKD